VLGSIGLGDAALQVVQACVPHRKLMFAACDSVSFSDTSRAGPMADGSATILVVRQPAHGSEPGAQAKQDVGGPDVGRPDALGPDALGPEDRGPDAAGPDAGRPDADHEDDGRSGAGRSVRPLGGGKPRAESLSMPRTGAGQLNGPAALPAWNVQVIDAAGRTLMTWKGLRMRDAGPFRQHSRSAAASSDRTAK
jgi:hypothetical protein